MKGALAPVPADPVGVERLRVLIAAHANRRADDRELFSHLLSLLCITSGAEFQLKDLLGALPTDQDQALSDALLAAMANLGFEASRSGTDPHKRRAGAHATLFIGPDERSPYVIAPDETGQVRVYGKLGWSPTLDELQSIRGECWSFRREWRVHAASEDQRKHTGHSWIRALAEHMRAVAVPVIGSSLAITALAFAMPLLVAASYRQVFGLADIAAMPGFAIAAIGVVVLSKILLMIRARALAWLAIRLDYLVGIASFGRLVGLPAALSDRADAKDQTARLRSFENIRDFLSSPTASTILEMPISIGVALLFAVIAPSLSGVILLTIAAFLLLFWGVWRRVRVQMSVLADEATELQRVSIETFEKRDLIRECGLEDRWADMQLRKIAREQKAQAGLNLLGAVSETLANFLLSVGLIALVARAAVLVTSGGLSPSSLLGLMLAGVLVLAPFHGLCTAVPRFEQARKSMQQINEFMQLPQEIQLMAPQRRLPEIRGNIAFLNTTFRVADTRPVFVGLDLSVRAGEVIGIAGSAGSGKSTILKMTQGLIDCAMGTIHIEGIDIRQLAVGELRRRIGYVPQAPQLLPGTYRDNLNLANPLSTPEQQARVLTLVGLAAHLPMLDLPRAEDVEEEADFRFRFALAQALLGGSKLLLIDEFPNSLMSAELGALLRRVIQSARGKRTVLFVSHRSDFLGLADRVIAMRYGAVPQILSSAELLQRAA